MIAETKHLTEARVLYRRVLARYSNREWAYDADYAKEAPASLKILFPPSLSSTLIVSCLADFQHTRLNALYS